MNDRLLTFRLTISGATISAIFSRVLAGGATRCALQECPTAPQCGQGPARAKPSRLPGSNAGSTTSATCGPLSSVSSKSAALQSCLENKLKTRFHTDGSTLFSMTWKEQTTPRGRHLLRLAASVRRTSESGSTGGIKDRSQLGDAPSLRLKGNPGVVDRSLGRENSNGPSTEPSVRACEGLGYADRNGRVGGAVQLEGRAVHPGASRSIAGFWSDAEWRRGADGKARPIEPGLEPLAYGVPARVVRLRGYGNAIVPQVAAAFTEAFLSSAEDCGLV